MTDVFARCQLKVYDATGVTLLGTLSRRRGVAFSVYLNRNAMLTVDVHKADPALVTTPTLLASLNIIKVGIDYGAGFVEREAYRIEHRETVVVAPPEQEDGGKYRTITARHITSILDDSIVYPEYALTRDTGEDRYFNFASAQGDWYVPAEWTAPFAGVVGSYPANFPEGWPDAGSFLLWPTDPAGGGIGEALFRASFSVGTTATRKIFVTADDYYDLYLDGELLSVQDTRLFQWGQAFDAEVTLTAGTQHLLAVQGVSVATPAAWVIIAVCDVNAKGEPTSTIYRSADGVGWLAHQVQPGNSYVGWRADQILRKLVLEAQARGVSPLDALTIGFDNALDSAGVAWTGRRLDRKFTVGTGYGDVTEQLTETGMDVAVGPDMVLRAWKSRGTNKSATVKFLPGTNLLEHQIGVTRPRKTRLLIRTLTGFVESFDATGETAHGRLEGYLTLGNTTSNEQADIVGDGAFAALASEQLTVTSAVKLVTGAVPYTDFDLGDIVGTVGEDGTTALPVTVVGMSFRETDAGLLDFVPEWRA